MIPRLGIRRLMSILCAGLSGLAVPSLPAVTCDNVVFLNGFEAGPAACIPFPSPTYVLQESTPSATLWTAPVARKVQAGSSLPVRQGGGMNLHAARNEFEPVQLLIEPVAAADSATLSAAPFPNLGASQRIDLALGAYEPNGWPEDLQPLAENEPFALEDTRATLLWITVYVPPDAPAGPHETALSLTIPGQGIISIPLKLYVFDFSLPEARHFDTQFNIAIQQPAHEFKQLLFEHRLTPGSATWPSGYSHSITWDSSANPDRCAVFWDEPTESEQFGIWALGPRYILGEGWNDVGFPDVMLFQFVSNDAPRPNLFCGEAIGDPFGTAAYNAEWSAFLTALQDYLQSRGLLEKTYQYVINEPQTQADYDLAAHLCRTSRAAAPDLRIAISEEPKPQIAEHSGGACGYDIWLAHVGAFQPAYATQRQADHGEAVWFYSLPQDPHPLFNPTLSDRQGMNVRIIPWVAWRYRSTGWAYYDGGSFFDGAEPGIRAELLREGLEDYEYLYLANGSQHPEVNVSGPGDLPALSAAKTLYSWTRDAEALMALRYQLGLYLEGKRATLPMLERKSSRPRGAYYLNFQDPAGQPLADPLIVDGKAYMKIGWQAYDEGLGYGWLGQFVGNTGVLLHGYLGGAAGYSEVEKSYIYDDFGRLNLFEFDLENGTYEVTIAVNRAGIGHGDPHNVTVEGVKVVDDETNNDLIVRTLVVNLLDGSLSLETGGRSAVTGDYAYTFLAHMDIVPVD
jgi:hypothetical protein